MDNTPWSVPIAVADIPDAGLHIEIEAPPEALVQLAALAKVRAVSRLSAVFDLTRHGAGVRVAGQLSALVVQNCVVTLELGSRGWVPTLELTTYLRALPVPGPWRIRQRAHLVRHGLVDETCHVWDTDGHLVGQATQLAAVRFP